MTTAIVLSILVAGALASYTGWAVVALAHGASLWWILAVAPIAAAAIPVAFAAFYFALAWVYRAPRPPERRIGAMASARLFACEAAAIFLSWPRMVLFRWLVRDPVSAPASQPVILLHGVLCNAGVWRGMCAFLAKKGIAPVYTLTFARPLASIEDFSDQLAARIDRVLAATAADRVALVAHSMGGLVARAYLRRHGAGKLAFVMTLGTPHHGSVHAWLFPGTSLEQLRPGSRWLAELNRSEGESFPVRFVSLWSWHDSMVAPQTSSRLAGASNVELVGIGHNALLGDRRVFERVAMELQAEQPSARGPCCPSAKPTSESPA